MKMPLWQSSFPMTAKLSTTLLDLSSTRIESAGMIGPFIGSKEHHL